jgi:ketosteroid isomerase-like protein
MEQERATAIEVRQAIQQMFERFQAGDIEGMESHLTPNCSVWDVFTPGLVVGGEARRAFHAEDKKQSQARGPLRWETRFVRLESWGDIFLACYYLDFTYDEPGAMSGSVRITDILRRVDDRWLIEHHHEGLIPEPLASVH